MDTEEIFTLHMGLRSLVYTHEPCNVLFCQRESFVYSEMIDADWPNDLMNTGIESCRTIASGTAFGAFTTCATLLFALMGTQNRMKFSSDANIQKVGILLFAHLSEHTCASFDIRREEAGQVIARISTADDVGGGGQLILPTLLFSRAGSGDDH